MKKFYIILLLLLLFSCDFSNIIVEEPTMSITIQPTPTPGEPGSTDDYNNQNIILQANVNNINQNHLFLTNWENLDKPEIKQGVYIQHGGALYLVTFADEVISGTPADGRCYVKLIPSGDYLLASFVSSASGFVWNHVYNGFYNILGEQLLPYVIIKYGSDYYKYSLEKSENRYSLESKIIVNYTQSLGLWNMQADSVKQYNLPDFFLASHNPLTPEKFYENMINLIVLIGTDNEISGTRNVLTIFGSPPAIDGYWYFFGPASIIYVSRYAGGVFDSTLYNDPAIERGKIVYIMRI